MRNVEYEIGVYWNHNHRSSSSSSTFPAHSCNTFDHTNYSTHDNSCTFPNAKEMRKHVHMKINLPTREGFLPKPSPAPSAHFDDRAPA